MVFLRFASFPLYILAAPPPWLQGPRAHSSYATAYQTCQIICVQAQ